MSQLVGSILKSGMYIYIHYVDFSKNVWNLNLFSEIGHTIVSPFSGQTAT